MTTGFLDRRAVEQWVDRYERLWRTSGTAGLAELFDPAATYRTSPWGPPIVGLADIAHFWDSEREGADEEFTMASEVVAVDGDAAVVRVEVEYAETGDRWRDLWVLTFAEDGRCSSFEEWPFAPPAETS
ncbi:MAG: YybH family protein [Nocardioides sp.]